VSLTGPAGISLVTPPVAGCQSVCVSSLLSASALCSGADLFITAQCSVLSAHCSCVHPLKSFTCLFVKNNCYCSTSRSLLPDACIDILHNSRWLLFHPRAVTPLGSPPRTARATASVHYACSPLCTCVQGDQIHHTSHTRSESQVSCLSLATRGQFGSGIRSHHDHHSEELSLAATFHCVQPLLRALFYSIYGHMLPLWAPSVL
jgi:hypothetical protein